MTTDEIDELVKRIVDTFLEHPNLTAPRSLDQRWIGDRVTELYPTPKPTKGRLVNLEFYGHYHTACSEWLRGVLAEAIGEGSDSC